MPDTIEETVQEETTFPSDEQIPAGEEVSAVEESGAEDQPVEDSGVDEGLKELARSYDLDPDVFPNQEQLEKAVTHFDRLLTQRARDGWSKPEQAEKPAEKTQPASLSRFDFKELEKVLPKDQYDENILKAFQALDGHYASQMEALAQRFPEVQSLQEKVSLFDQFLQQQEQRQYEQKLDGFFDGLGEEWGELFGKGPLSAMKNPKAARERVKFSEELAAIQFGDSQLGRQQTFEQQAQRALRAAFGSHETTHQRRKIATAANQRRNGALSRPASKTGKPLNPEAVAIAKVKEWQAKHVEG